MKFKTSMLAIVVSATSVGPSLQAAEWGLGVGAGVKQKEYVDFDHQYKLLPVLLYENDWLKVAGVNLDVKAGHYAGLNFSLRAKFALGDGYEQDDSTIFTGMEDRDASIWLGPQVDWETKFGTFSFNWLADAFDNSGGQQASLQYSNNYRISDRWILTPELGISWLSDDYVDYYYGVTAAEATAQRAIYTADATTNIEAALSARYLLNKQSSLSVKLSYQSLGSEIKDSPLVDSSGQGSLMMYYLYRF